jgi:hypothetical protein
LSLERVLTRGGRSLLFPDTAAARVGPPGDGGLVTVPPSVAGRSSPLLPRPDRSVAGFHSDVAGFHSDVAGHPTVKHLCVMGAESASMSTATKVVIGTVGLSALLAVGLVLAIALGASGFA